MKVILLFLRKIVGQLITKLQITKILIVLGFFLNVAQYTLDLAVFYFGSNEVAFAMDDSDPLEKENSENEDFKEKEKISQYNDDVTYSSSILTMRLYPELEAHNSFVCLEYETPPPEFL